MTSTKQTPDIHVGVLLAPRIHFKLKGNYIYENKTFEGKLYAQINNNQMELLAENKVIYKGSEISLQSPNISNNRFDIENVVIGIDFHWEQNEKQSFRGALKLKQVGEQIQAINILPLENYLESVISSEMSATSSLNLLKAHAVISRSWLLAQISKQAQLTTTETIYQSESEVNGEYIRWYDREDHKEFHVCADDHCQRYQGITRAQNLNVVKAVNETCGMVLEYNHEICDARFSKCCGGVSEVFENCWEPIQHPYLSKVIDTETGKVNEQYDLKKEESANSFILDKPKAFCNTDDAKILKQVLNNYDQSASDFYRWVVHYSKEELSELIKKKSRRDFGEIQDLIPVERGESGRLIKLKIVGSKLSLTIGKELEIRRWLSESHLYSSAISIEKNDNEFIIHGAGWGHGVGLCQIGAAVMGEQGYNYTQILQHYYKNAEIKTRY